jgi:hypothetical protein
MGPLKIQLGVARCGRKHVAKPYVILAMMKNRMLPTSSSPVSSHGNLKSMHSRSETGSDLNWMFNIRPIEHEAAALTEESQRVIVDDAADETLRVTATTQLQNKIGDGGRF